MRTYSEFKDVQEHNPLAIRNIVKAINPLDKLQDKLKRSGGISGMAKKAIQKKMDALNPMSDINKKATMSKKKELRTLKKQRKGINDKLKTMSKRINDLEDEVRT